VLIAIRKQGLIDGRDFIGGFELGAEVASGAGSRAIDALGHTFAKYDITSGKDALTGTGADDLIDGRGGNDAIAGGAGGDDLDRGRGRDRLAGGEDSDRLVGDPGGDSFVFDAALDRVANIGRIGDFEPGMDRIILDEAVFAGLVSGHLPRGAFHAGKAAADSGDRIIHDRKAGTLCFDPDGVGGKDTMAFARVHPGLGISAGDFLMT
jgi:Ca2+-binding RTX toxin-like protein